MSGSKSYWLKMSDNLGIVDYHDAQRMLLPPGATCVRDQLHALPRNTKVTFRAGLGLTIVERRDGGGTDGGGTVVFITNGYRKLNPAVPNLNLVLFTQINLLVSS